ncbi:glycoside hydrolase domain-containing protein [Streptomyces cirratus]
MTSGWVRHQAEAGWHLMPIWVGPQPWDSSSTGLSTDPSEASDEGVEAADGAVEAARSLGLGANTVLYNDLEHYTDRDTWDAPVVAYLTAWTARLHALGYRSAAYVHAASGVPALSAHYHQAPQDMPDVLWVARWNLSASGDGRRHGLPAGGAQWPAGAAPTSSAAATTPPSATSRSTSTAAGSTSTRPPSPRCDAAGT